MRHLPTRFVSFCSRVGRNEIAFLGGIMVVCLGAWLFLAVAAVVAHESFREVEEQAMRAWRNPADSADLLGPWWVEELARDISALGSAVVVIMLSLFVMSFLLLRRYRGRAALVTVTVLGGYLLSNALKSTYARARPEVVPHLTEVSSASFPSGHSMVSSLVYLTLGALLAQTTPRRREKLFFLAAAAMLTALIGVSRVALGVHYPTDVIAGWSAGTAWAVACLLIAWKWRQAGGRRNSRSATRSENSVLDTGRGQALPR
jgi:undecaprenyl-diphosphatase